ncbi:uncharacterized protein LOC143635027 [Bidens hawaiensis]|uniref:uncharacterized protein LOC143635027 n=1 Tax=Bidens hawaiensis TaxID=980011 RepID=UPI00404B321D
MSDPGSFTISWLTGNLFVSNALADLGASINLMPYTIFTKLGLGEPIPTRMSIQLAGRSMKYPRCIVENILVKIDKFVFPVGFVILYMDKDTYVPIILGRPFLDTARELIDVCTDKLTLRVEDEEVTFDIGKSKKHPQYTDDYAYFLDMCESIVSCLLRKTIEKEACDTHLIEEKAHTISSKDRVVFKKKEEEEESNLENTFKIVDIDLDLKAKPFVEDPPTIELKELPKHLEYTFLERKSKLPIIISSDLSIDEENRKMNFLNLIRKPSLGKSWTSKASSRHFVPTRF